MSARAFWWYALAAAGAIALSGAGLALVYGSPAQRQAILLSAVIAFVVQVLAFAVARLMAATGNGIAGWALGAVICLVILVVYGFVSRGIGLPSDTAMISLATFFFLTEVIEPPFLNR